MYVRLLKINQSANCLLLYMKLCLQPAVLFMVLSPSRPHSLSALNKPLYLSFRNIYQLTSRLRFSDLFQLHDSWNLLAVVTINGHSEYILCPRDNSQSLITLLVNWCCLLSRQVRFLSGTSLAFSVSTLSWQSIRVVCHMTTL